MSTFSELQDMYPGVNGEDLVDHIIDEDCDDEDDDSFYHIIDDEDDCDGEE